MEKHNSDIENSGGIEEIPLNDNQIIEGTGENFGGFDNSIKSKATLRKEARQNFFNIAYYLSLFLLSSYIVYLITHPNVVKQKKDVSFVMVSMGDIVTLEKSLDSFYSSNTYQLNKSVIVVNGQSRANLSNLITKYSEQQNIEWVVIENYVGPFVSLDTAYDRIETPFIFVSMSNFIFNKGGFIEKSLDLMDNSNISQVTIKKLPGINKTEITAYDSILSGFSLLPSLHRLSNYHLFNGYSNVTYNLTYGKLPGKAEQFISLILMSKGFHIYALEEEFVQEIVDHSKALTTWKYTSSFEFVKLWQRPSQEYVNTCKIVVFIEKGKKKLMSYQNEARRKIRNMIFVNRTEINNNLQNYGINEHIQIGSKFDYLGLQNNVNYSEIVDMYRRTFVYNDFITLAEKKIEKPIPPINIKTALQSSEVKSIFSKKEPVPLEHSEFSIEESVDFEIQMGEKLHKKPNDNSLLEAEFQYYSEKYNISSITEELELCLFIEGFNLANRSSFNLLLDSINNQNYSNFKLIFIDDGSKDETRKIIYDKAKIPPRLSNRIPNFIKNEERIGTAGNNYIRAKTYCEGSDVVVPLTASDILLGRQTLKVINAVYQDKENWVVLFRSIQEKENHYFAESYNIEKVEDLRQKGFNADLFLATYRPEIMSKIPIEHLLEFKFNNETETVYPQFYISESNVFHVYSLAELSGNNRFKILKDPILIKFPLSPENRTTCEHEISQYQKTKSQLKTPLLPLENISSSVQVSKNHTISLSTLSNIRIAHKNVETCKKVNDFINATVPIHQTFKEYLKMALGNMTMPEYYMNNESMPIGKLPFCLIAGNLGNEVNDFKLEEILVSIRNQKYEKTVVLLIGEGKETNYSALKAKVSKRSNKIYNITIPKSSYFEYKTAIHSLCEENSLVMFLNNPLSPQALHKLNEVHQKQNVWMTYSLNPNDAQIHSFYMRIYDLMETNDFEETNKAYLEQGDHSLFALAMLELCGKFSYNFNETEITTREFESNITYFRAEFKNPKVYIRSPYTVLLTLSQDFPIEPAEHAKRLRLLMINSKGYRYSTLHRSKLTNFDLLRAQEYEQMPYLPESHMLHLREFINLDNKYNIGKYMSGEYENKTHRFCLTIFGRNNTDNGRVQKNLKSILQQNYSNYHIVFMDDESDDGTMEVAKKYIQESGFPKDRIKFVENYKRKFALYNIINSAYNLCDEDDIQIRMDGDDEIIGRNTMSLLNSMYHSDPNYWVVYTNFKTSLYGYGLGVEVSRKSEILGCDGLKGRIHFIVPVTSWRVKLIKQIPLHRFMMEHGGWYDTLYDDCLQFSFFELASLKRIKYVPYINYLNNVEYGWNDNSDEDKVFHRTEEFANVLTLHPLQPIRYIDGGENPEVSSLLKMEMETDMGIS